MMSQDPTQFIEQALAGGMAVPQVAQALGQRFPQLPLADGARAIRRLVALSQPAALAAVDGAKGFVGASAAAGGTADPVEDAAYEAWLLRLAYPSATSIDIGTQIHISYPALTTVQMAQVLIHGQPYPVFPDLRPVDMAATLIAPPLGGATSPNVATALHTVYPALSALDVGRVLLSPSVFPSLTANGMKASLSPSFPADQVAAAIAQLYPAPPPPSGQPLLVVFDGTNQVAIPSLAAYNFGPGQDFTVEAWIRAPRQNNLNSWDNNIIEKWSDDGGVPGRTGYPFALRIGNQNGGSAGRLFAARYDLSNNPSIQSAGAFLDDRFHHVAMTNAGRRMTLYVDGQVQGTTTDTTSGPTGNDWPLYLGVRGGQLWPDNFTGRIMEVRLWNQARTQEQITATMRRTVDPGSAGLVGYFKLRDGTGAIARDSSPAGNAGVIINPRWAPVDGYPLVETTSFPAVGGGGVPFDDTAAALASGRPLTRIRIRSGNIVDSIQAFYGDTALPAHGGTGGGQTDINLTPGDPITSMKGFWGTWFGGTYVLMLVFKTASGQIFGPYGDMKFASSRNSINFDAPPGQALLAFTGAVGTGNNGQSQYLGSFGITTGVIYP